MTSYFGTLPYRACFCGAAEEDALLEGNDGPADQLKQLVQECKQGDFSNIDALSSLMTDGSFDVRQYSHQLFAHVCNHKKLSCFENAVAAVEDRTELCRLVVRLGETLSLQAIPLLLSIQDDHADEELDGYVCMALRNILPLPEVSEDTIGSCDAKSLYSSAIEQLNTDLYYYRGQPVFVGDVTKELVQASLIANRENRSIVLVRQPQVLSNFSGVECPVTHGQSVTESDVNAVFDYVEGLAKLPWRRGVKYFYGHVIA